jgi:hypothetical protein
MKQSLSVFFNNDRTYFAMFEKARNGLVLTYVNSTNYPVNFSRMDDENTKQAVMEVEEIIYGIKAELGRISVTLAGDNVLVSQIPGMKKIDVNELRKLVSFEIRQSYPQFNFDDFITNIIPFEPRLDAQNMMMAVIMPKQDLESCRELLQPLNQPVDNIEISQLNAHTAFMYNYPERSEQTVALFGIQGNFVDISVIRQGKPLYYNIAILQDLNKIGELCDSQFQKIIASYTRKIDGAFFFGSGLTKNLFKMASESAQIRGIESFRLNAFRMMGAKLEDREREYCTRVAHVYPPCIGGGIPAYHERFKLY